MLAWTETSRLLFEQSTLAALNEHFAENSGVLPPYRLPTLAKQIVEQMMLFLSDAGTGSGLDAAAFGAEIAQQGLALRSWLAVGRALASDLTTRICEPAAASDELPDAAAVLERLQLFVAQVVEGLVRHEITEISSQRDEMHAALEQVIQAREDELRGVIQELSTPVMPVHRKILVMPLIGDIDDERARRITEALLDETVRHKARIVIIDVTGLGHCGVEILQALSGAVRAVRFLGTRAVLAGIQPAMAQTLAGLEPDLGAFTTLADLQSAIRWALGELGLAILPRTPRLTQVSHRTNKENERHGD
jgi:rsbT co-antagonist protein RsbR